MSAWKNGPGMISAILSPGRTATVNPALVQRGCEPPKGRIRAKGISRWAILALGLLVPACNSGGTGAGVVPGGTESPGLPGMFLLVSPANDSDPTSPPTFTWEGSNGATSYTLEVATNKAFSNPVVSQAGINGTTYSLGLGVGLIYYWRVTAVNAQGSTLASNAPWTFAMPAVDPPPPSGVLLVNQASALALAVLNDATSSGSLVVQSTPTGSGGQIWLWTPTGDGTY